MAVLTVGTGKTYARIRDAIAAARDGDVVQVQAGTYVNDFATIRQSITLTAVGGMAHVLATTPPPNGKAILTVGRSAATVTIDGFELSGAAVPDRNGAGIRYEGGSLTLVNSYLHDNQNGLLAASDPTGSITIRNSEFARNGAGDGRSHNLYVNDLVRLSVDGSLFRDAVVGHQIKSRAQATSVTNSRIFDRDGTASYSVDLPNGGNASIANNVIEQGPNSQNPAIIAFGAEGSLRAGGALTVTGNTFVNRLASASAKAVWNATGITASLRDNTVFGLTARQIASGPAEVAATTFAGTAPALDLSSPWVRTSAPPGTDDVLLAGPGSELLDGGAGWDRVVEGYGLRGTTVSNEVNGDRTVAHGSNRDTLRNVEEIVFVDGRLALDANDPAAQVSRLYLAAFGRGAEQAGLNHWTVVLQAGTPLLAISAAFVGSAEFSARYRQPDNAGFVDVLYRNVLGREPDAGSRAAWVAQLDAGASRSGMLVAFSEGQEFRTRTAGLQTAGIWDRDEAAAQIARLYDTLLSRLPDPAGLAGWKEQLTSGAMTLNGIADAFQRAPEFLATQGVLSTRDFVLGVYSNALGSLPGQAEADAWVSQINAGQNTRSGFALAISEGAAHQALTASDLGGESAELFGIRFLG